MESGRKGSEIRRRNKEREQRRYEEATARRKTGREKKKGESVLEDGVKCANTELRETNETKRRRKKRGGKIQIRSGRGRDKSLRRNRGGAPSVAMSPG